MAIVRIINVGAIPQRIEFLNDTGQKDSSTIISHGSSTLDEALLLTTPEDLKRKRLKIVALVQVEPAPVVIEQPAPVVQTKVEEPLVEPKEMPAEPASEPEEEKKEVTDKPVETPTPPAPAAPAQAPARPPQQGSNNQQRPNKHS
jgi:hypothetical protein